MKHDAVKLDRHATLPRSTAAAKVKASTWGATSWARKSAAPRSNAATAAPIEAAVLPTRPCRISEHTCERALPREADENRSAEVADPLEAADQLEVLVGSLAEADPRVEADVLLGDPGSDCDCQAALEEAGNLSHDIAVSRRDLHRARVSLHVHETNVRTAVSDHARESRIAPQGGDVVDERGTQLECSARDLGLGRVNRHGQSRQPLEHGHDAAQLLVKGDT